MQKKRSIFTHSCATMLKLSKILYVVSEKLLITGSTVVSAKFNRYHPAALMSFVFCGNKTVHYYIFSVCLYRARTDRTYLQYICAWKKVTRIFGGEGGGGKVWSGRNSRHVVRSTVEKWVRQKKRRDGNRLFSSATELWSKIMCDVAILKQISETI